MAWADADDETDLGEELWGAGFFVGSYPVLGHLGVILCGPADLTRQGSAALAAQVRRQIDHPEGGLLPSSTPSQQPTTGTTGR